MYKKKECIAMLLAGGQGSRLQTLTRKNAKPAVGFGGKYRLIDFPLSNCVNSGIDTVGVLTQYQPLTLNEYIGNGQPWDLDRSNGGVIILPPYKGSKRSDWYKGTANAIYQNMDFIKRYSPKYVVILSGDHIYKMNYSDVINEHIRSCADCTVAVIDVPKHEASRFGIMEFDEDGRIISFEEKPKKPKSTHASMGVYIFNSDILYRYLEKDAADETSSNDFGKNVIPAMIKDGRKMYVFRFDGYWKDVGTIESLWEANMDLLGEHPRFDLNDRHWRIYSRAEPLPPHYIGCRADVTDSIITGGCCIEGRVKNSVLFSSAVIEPDAEVINSVIMSNVRIERGASINHAIIDEDAVIGKDTRIGIGEERKITVIGTGTEVRDEFYTMCGITDITGEETICQERQV